MALDGIVLNKVKKDFERYLPIRINRIAESSKTEIIFNVHANGLRTNLVMSFHSNYNHLCLSDRKYATFNDPSTFIMVLRKYLINGFIYQIDQIHHDRFLLMHIRARDELYDEKEDRLSIERRGKYANRVLVDENNKIIDALKKIPPYENTRRTILPGAQFTLPDDQHKNDPFSSFVPDLDESLVAQLQGFSKTLEKELRYRLASESYEEIIREIEESDSLYLTRINDTFEYHIIPLTHLELPFEKWPIQQGFDEVYYRNDETERIRNIADDLFKIVKRQIKHYDNKINKLQASLEDALNLENDKENGDLLYQYEDLERKGLKELEICGYDGRTKTISLDPKLSVKANANKYYSVYQKKRKGKVYIEEQIAIAQEELTYFKALNEQLSIADYADALDIKEELIRYGYLKNRSNKKQNKKKINLYRFQVDGYTVTFGKNNLQNSYLTFEYAKNGYTWFHAKGFHGCHLVVDSNQLNEKIIRICANTAAYYSQGRYSSSVPVDYCEIRNVKKIKGARPGFVSYKNYKTIYIDPYDDKELTVTTI